VARISPLFVAILRGERFLLILCVPVSFLPFLQICVTKSTTVVAPIHVEGVGSWEKRARGFFLARRSERFPNLSPFT